MANFYNPYIGAYCVGDTSAVGTYPTEASPYGLLDMAGNVREWVNDWYQSDYYSVSPSSNPPGPATGTFKVNRGGDCISGDQWMRVAYRHAYNPTQTYYILGFRCAADAAP